MKSKKIKVIFVRHRREGDMACCKTGEHQNERSSTMKKSTGNPLPFYAHYFPSVLYLLHSSRSDFKNRQGKKGETCTILHIVFYSDTKTVKCNMNNTHMKGSHPRVFCKM